VLVRFRFLLADSSLNQWIRFGLEWNSPVHRRPGVAAPGRCGRARSTNDCRCDVLGLRRVGCEEGPLDSGAFLLLGRSLPRRSNACHWL
jgi:hypothetical protein